MSDEGSSALRQIYAAFTLQADPRQLTSADNAVEGLIGKLQTLGAVLAGSRLISAVANFANGIEAEAHTIENASARLGISTTQYQELAFAADEAGVGQQTLTNSLARMSAQLGQTGGHASKAAQALHGLGIDTHRADGSLRDVADITGDLSDALNGMNPDQMQAVLRQIGGPGMARLAPLMHQGAGGVRELTEEFRRLGGGLSGEALEQADRYGAETRKLDVVLYGLKSTLALSLFPVLREGIEWVEQGALGIKHFTDNSNALKHGLELLELVVGTFAAEMLLANLPVIAGAAGILALALAYDDVRTAMEGGTSAIGNFVDAHYGAGSSIKLTRELNSAWTDLKGTVGGTAQDLRYLLAIWMPEWLENVYNWVNRIVDAIPGMTSEATALAALADQPAAINQAAVDSGDASGLGGVWDWLGGLTSGGTPPPPTAAQSSGELRTRLNRNGGVGQTSAVGGIQALPQSDLPIARLAGDLGRLSDITRGPAYAPVGQDPRDAASGAVASYAPPATPTVVQRTDNSRTVYNITGNNTQEIVAQVRRLHEEHRRSLANANDGDMPNQSDDSMVSQ